MIAKRNPSLVTTFALLSCGYIFSSYQEVKSVVLHTLNRASFTVAVDSFLKTALSLINTPLLSGRKVGGHYCTRFFCWLFSLRCSIVIDVKLLGRVPTLQEGNAMESVFNLPWINHSPIVLGSRFKDAFQDAKSYLAIEPVFERERYVVTYNPFKSNIYALFKDQAKPDDILKATFHANVLLHIIRSSDMHRL